MSYGEVSAEGTTVKGGLHEVVSQTKRNLIVQV
jgi:hypothetical protein